MKQQETHDLRTLEREFAQRLVAWFASDDFYSKVFLQYQHAAFILANRERLQPLARRHLKNPLTFFRKTFGKKFRFSAENVPKGKQRALENVMPLLDACIGPETRTLSEQERKAVPKLFAALLADNPGRKRLQLYVAAAQFAQQGAKTHEICIKLYPGYKNLTVLERRAARDQLRSGIKRALKRGLGSSRPIRRNVD